MKALWLSKRDVESLEIPMTEVMDAVEEGFRLNGLDQSELPAKIGVHPGRTALSTPCLAGWAAR